jgi:hypothetical protein
MPVNMTKLMFVPTERVGLSVGGISARTESADCPAALIAYSMLQDPNVSDAVHIAVHFPFGCARGR